MRHAAVRRGTHAGSPSAHEDNASFVARIVRRLGRRAVERGTTGVLSADDMSRLWQELLAESLTPLQEAAVLMGLRIHGESAEMLAACAEATRPWCAQLPARDRATVVLHCIGTARRQPALAPLVAMRLAELDVRVLVVTHAAPGRAEHASAATVFQALGIGAAANATHAAQLLGIRRLAWLPVQALSPALARLLGRRAELGFRNTAHAAIKLLAPVERAVVVANYTHAAYRDSFGGALRLLRRSAALIRGIDGDPVAWTSEGHGASAWVDGEQVDLPRNDAEAENASTSMEPWPSPDDIAGTASFIRDRLAARAIPAPIETQVRQLEALALAVEARSAGAAEARPPASPAPREARGSASR